MDATHQKTAADGFQGARKIVVLDNNKSQCAAMCNLLADRGYQTVPAWSLSDLNLFLQKKSCLVVLIDLDTVEVDNRTIKALTVQNPGVYFICLSSSRFHPELKESICYHIYACINRPVDPDELFYLIGSIYKEEAYPNCQS